MNYALTRADRFALMLELAYALITVISCARIGCLLFYYGVSFFMHITYGLFVSVDVSNMNSPSHDPSHTSH